MKVMVMKRLVVSMFLAAALLMAGTAVSGPPHPPTQRRPKPTYPHLPPPGTTKSAPPAKPTPPVKPAKGDPGK